MHVAFGKISGLECRCGYDKTFFVKSHSIVCSNCGRSHSCTPPILGIVKGECRCGYDKTFVVDSNQDYICTNCGRHR